MTTDPPLTTTTTGTHVIRAIDCWVNPFTPEVAATQRPEFLVRAATDYFHRAEEVFRGTPLDEMVALMAQNGIDAGLLTIDAANPAPMAEAAARYGGRFLLSAVVDPTQGMQAVRLVERLVKDWDVRLIRIIPFLPTSRSCPSTAPSNRRARSSCGRTCAPSTCARTRSACSGSPSSPRRSSHPLCDRS